MKFLTKWFGGIVLAGIFGYFVVGPKLAGDHRLKSLAEKGAEAVARKIRPGEMGPDENAPVPEDDAAEGSADAPKVTVGKVTPVEERRSR